MAMSQSAISRELQRKKNLGVAPTSSANNSAYNALKSIQPSNAGGSAISSALNNGVQNNTANTNSTINTGTNNLYSNLTTPKDTFSTYKPFEYTQANIEADPTYQAALRTAQGNIQTGQNNTLANLIANGQGNSSYSAGVSQQIANKEMANVSDNILPELIKQAYGRHLDTFNANNQVEGQNYGVGRDQVADNFKEWELTGQGISEEARGIIGKILQEKQEYDTATDDAGRQSSKSDADSLRSALAALGYDPAMFGSNVDLNTAQSNISKAGIKTLAGRGQDYNEMADTRNYDRGVVESDRGFNRGVLESDRTFEENNKQFGLTYALQQLSNQQDNARGWANIGQGNASNALSRERFEYEKEQDKNNPKVNLDSDPDFADAVQGVLSDSNALSTLKTNASTLIAKFGREGYDALVEYATPKKQSSNDILSQFFAQ